MRVFHYALALFAMTALVACDHQHPKGALSVNKEMVVSASPEEVWDVIGDFYGLDAWHPAVASTQRSGAKVPTRILVLGNGGIIREELVDGVEGKSYTYQIIESPLPVENYVSTLSVMADNGGSKIVWVADFDNVAGSDPDEVVGIISGVYDAGFESLGNKF